jgi:cytoskeletal protein RodZ
MVEVLTRQTALVSVIAILLTALVCPASAQVQPVQDTQDTVDDAQDATQDTVDDAQDATQDTVDDAQDATQDAVDDAQDATQDTVDDAQDATQDTVDDAQDATQDTVDDAQGTADRAAERAKRTKADQKKVGDPQNPPKTDVDDLSELVAEGESIGGTFQARDEAGPSQTSPLDRVGEMLGLPITGMELLAMAAIGVTLAIVGVALWRLGRRRRRLWARTSRREIKRT